MSMLNSPASRTSPRLVASQSMAYLFIEGNEAKFCDRADLVAGTSVSPGAEKTLTTAIVVSLVLFGVTSFLWMVGPEPVSNDWLWIGKGHFSDSHICTDISHAWP